MTRPETVSAAELERMMKLQDVILKAIAKQITRMAAAEIAGVSDRTMRRIKQRYEEFGYDGLFDQRRGKRSIHRIPLEIAEQVLSLYQEKYFDFSVLHFHEKLRKDHKLQVSYSWVKQALQGAGLVKKRNQRGPHRRRRPRRPPVRVNVSETLRNMIYGVLFSGVCCGLLIQTSCGAGSG